jgi:hypothetical protein
LDSTTHPYPSQLIALVAKFPILLAPQAYIFALSSQHQSLHPEDGGSKILQNTGILPQYFRASETRKT